MPRRRARAPRAHKNEAAMLEASKAQERDERKVEAEENLLIAQEIKIARFLANPDKKIRDRTLKKLKKWMTLRSTSSFEFTETEFIILWKGLFYCMWYSDMMLIQEELAETISQLVHCLKSMADVVLYTACGLTTLGTEWLGLDHYALNKFYMLVKRILRQTFVACRNNSWDMEWVTNIADVLEKLFLDPKLSLGFKLHITFVYLEELAKVSDENLSEEAVHGFIQPFVVYLAASYDARPRQQIQRHIFRHLIFQSDLGMDYTQKFEVWKNSGFPCVSMDDIQKIEMSEEESDEELSTKGQDVQSKPLDPRAGRVDVELPQLPFNPAKIAEQLKKHKFHPTSTSKSRRQVTRLIAEFNELAEGSMPLGVKRVRKPYAQKNTDMDSQMAALRLIQSEKPVEDKLSRKQKRKRHDSIMSYHADEALSSLDNSKKMTKSDVDTSNCELDDSKNDSVDVPAIRKANMQNSSADVLPKKRKRSVATHDEFAGKRETTENKEEEPEIKVSTKINKMKKIKAKHTSDAHAADKSTKRKTRCKKLPREQDSGNEDQCTSAPIALISQHRKKPKKIKDKPIIKKQRSKIGALRDDQVTPLRTELSNKIKNQLDKSSSAKKKVVFGLSRNTAQHTSEYLQQIRNSPAIPFDANKKPLTSALKTSPLPSPINPFYKKKLSLQNQRI
ncbi:hypothetical protein DMN91_011404 [Ooceraea biroi]|uniref:Ribosomal RNA processing protein 1-like protein n=1 Tax=Ooceraea biroi TaxID=2015173 RepID=A0A026W1N4_OOCBI|nr:ribosomal RNA processing protein 1 homolog [Ooceraea biroi]EZA49980.1 Ribosomal RNA processing protein 1-like protein [Ooceraea biroi]RLU15650.1 hypothetical protein DMN91_011404 [Ooceraea biroi]